MISAKNVEEKEKGSNVVSVSEEKQSPVEVKPKEDICRNNILFIGLFDLIRNVIENNQVKQKKSSTVKGTLLYFLPSFIKKM